jgi:hypothetical protein
LTPALLRRRAVFGIVTPNSSDTARRREATRFAGRIFVMWRSSVGSCGARALRGLPYTVEDGCDPPNGPGPEEIPPQVVCLAFVYCRQARLSTVFS